MKSSPEAKSSNSSSGNSSSDERSQQDLIKEVQRLTHENKILKTGINLIHKKNSQKERENKGLKKEIYDFRTNEL